MNIIRDIESQKKRIKQTVASPPRDLGDDKRSELDESQ